MRPPIVVVQVDPRCRVYFCALEYELRFFVILFVGLERRPDAQSYRVLKFIPGIVKKI